MSVTRLIEVVFLNDFHTVNYR